jgi:hypothetical protein
VVATLSVSPETAHDVDAVVQVLPVEESTA